MQFNAQVRVYSSWKAWGLRTYNSGFDWCSHALRLAGVTVLDDFHIIWFRYFLVLVGFPLHLEQVNIDLIIWHNEKSETTSSCKSLAVCNIATRSGHLLEFHFHTARLIIWKVHLEEDRFVKHMCKYEFNKWSDPIYITVGMEPTIYGVGLPLFWFGGGRLARRGSTTRDTMIFTQVRAVEKRKTLLLLVCIGWMWKKVHGALSPGKSLGVSSYTDTYACVLQGSEPS